MPCVSQSAGRWLGCRRVLRGACPRASGPVRSQQTRAWAKGGSPAARKGCRRRQQHCDTLGPSSAVVPVCRRSFSWAVSWEWGFPGQIAPRVGTVGGLTKLDGRKARRVLADIACDRRMPARGQGAHEDTRTATKRRQGAGSARHRRSGAPARGNGRARGGAWQRGVHLRT